ncbi:hypothetical protein GJ496_007809 [Pomphorhynchus laevis]|nr:hypothetical protein GJ496_007809 [Pomphorhynchus laevis]
MKRLFIKKQALIGKKGSSSWCCVNPTNEMNTRLHNIEFKDALATKYGLLQKAVCQCGSLSQNRNTFSASLLIRKMNFAKSMGTIYLGFSRFIDKKKILKEILNSPLINRSQKVEVLDAVCKELNISPIISSSMRFMFVKHNESSLNHIINDLEWIEKEIGDNEKCILKFAHPLTISEQNELRDTVKSLIASDKTLDIQFQFCPSIIGGCQIEIANKQIDLSFASGLSSRYSKFFTDMKSFK